jgi:hypothetical protein
MLAPRYLTVAAALSLAFMDTACLASALSPDDGRVPAGTWGGEHVALTVTDAGAHAEFDCASADITQPLTVDRGGRVAVEGVYVREHGGPVRLGEEPDRPRALFSGRLDGKILTIDITLIESKEIIGHFTVTLGSQPRVRKCR